MTIDQIFFRTDTGMEVLAPAPFDSEVVLQALLAKHPDVIAGTSTTDATPQRLLLVKREMGVPSEEGGSRVWSVDHLFVTADGIPVIVEVKRSTDTRIRREMVGQMLDYAANGPTYWPISELRAAAAATADALATKGPTVQEFLAKESDETDEDAFWSKVETNMREGRLRLVFVADKLPPELVRVIEFLNEQMPKTDVLGVEVQQYKGVAQEIYIPRFIGRTTEAQAIKTATSSQTQWDEQSFFAHAEEHSPDAALFFLTVLGHVREQLGGNAWGGRGSQPRLNINIPCAGRNPLALTMSANPRSPGLGVMFRWLYQDGAGVPADRLKQFVADLADLPGVEQTWGGAEKANWLYVNSVPVNELLKAEDAVGRVCAALDRLFAPVTPPQLPRQADRGETHNGLLSDRGVAPAGDANVGVVN